MKVCDICKKSSLYTMSISDGQTFDLCSEHYAKIVKSMFEPLDDLGQTITETVKDEPIEDIEPTRKRGRPKRQI